ncbi:SsgA family sporulation/cell division regulator [Amycolatopsis japonica]
MLSTPLPEPPRTSVELVLAPLLNGKTPYRVDFLYTVASPWMVLLRCHNPGGRLEWLLARDLLALGMSTEVGEGDVRVVPDTDHVWISFTGPEGTAFLCFDRGELDRALSATETLVRPGTESELTDWDTAFAALANPA